MWLAVNVLEPYSLRLISDDMKGGWYASSITARDNEVPTLLNEKGFKFFFYANEHPPPHVHVMKAGGWAKIETETSVVIYSSLKKQELKECLELVSLHRQEFLEVWNDWFIR